MTEIMTNLINFVTSIIVNSGYIGIFFLMVGESAMIPIPSEIIIPFSGYLVSTGKLNLSYVVIISSFGNLVGSVILYYIGRCLGREFLLKYGRYLLLKKTHLEITEYYFEKYGDKSTFVSRMLPLIRSLISFPAGLAKMSLKKFILYTFAGSLIWNLSLTLIGMQLGSNWESILHYSNYLDVMVIVSMIIIAIIYLRGYVTKN